ncbi:GDHL1 [Auxenochlorella protothecoides x Auxenochlorella symbiontica]|uniref:Glutamate dehydrogenase n=2 Tax=Auxenochlorella protothecoides TaxID=3075 RepID=A0A087SFJ9_AUXPR|nr:NADP-specific glutamate dehydrogenase [Auxenochlorella protothecoides]KFM24503.1 NADP-specific glutamate dehydrogenase [Auxenochlorella protothecoides]
MGKDYQGDVDSNLQKLQKGIQHDGLKAILEEVYSRNPEQAEFLQAVRGMALSIAPVFEKHPEYLPAFRMLTEPERQVIFRVPWVDDAGVWQMNRGMRVQFSSAIGPYKGGLRFHPSVTLSIIKFLGFEQIFKNALTTLPMGGGKGGADFDPKGRSDSEIMRFCQSFMTELYRHIGSDTDVPAGDIGVGGREIGYMYGQYKRITRDRAGVLTGKGMGWGGSEIRPEATGYGVVFLAEYLLADRGDSLEGKRCLVSGSGNVAQYCVELLLEKGAVVLSMSDSRGMIYAPEGLSREDLAAVMKLKSQHDGKLEDLELEGVEYRGDAAQPWFLDTEVFGAFPCATQNELGEEAAKALVKHGVQIVLEGANMPCTLEAEEVFTAAEGVAFVTGKASNAGGVAVSGLEMAQNRSFVPWSREDVTTKLQGIMKAIYDDITGAAAEYDTDLINGANIASFEKVAKAVLAQGAV